MCTAISYLSRSHYFGRTLDLEYHYQEAVTITPRKFPFVFRQQKTSKEHYAIIGMATVSENYPLYYDATNEYGLSMAGLNFPDNACYLPTKVNKNNIASFELIPWVLTQCKTVNDTRQLLENTNLIPLAFNENFPVSPLHWMIADNKESIVVEPGKTGLEIYQNPVGVLTNNPPFEFQLHNLNNYLNVTAQEGTNRFSNNVTLNAYSRGMGGIGLPGDLSSSSRFVRCVFTKLNSVEFNNKNSDLSQFFHILNAVAQQRGCVKVNEEYEYTVYTSCCDTHRGIYYYTTYENSQISAVNMHSVDLENDKLITYPLLRSQNIHYIN